MTSENVATATLQERIALARSPETTDEILMLLAQDRKLDVRRALTERKDLSDQLMKQLVNDKSKDIRLRMVGYPELKAEFQDVLAGSREVDIRVALALRDDAPEDILLKLAATNNRNVGLAILKRSTFSDKLLGQLAIHKSADVRCMLARRNDVSEDLLLTLASSNNKSVGLAILKRTKLSDELLEQLITHGGKDVRSALALRKTLPDALITTLVEDNDNRVVTAVGGRAQLPDEYIKKLSTHKNKKVRAGIAARNDLPRTMIEELSMEKNIEVFYAVANRDDLPEYLLDKMLSENNSTLRTRLAQRVSLRHDVVKVLAQDESEKVRAVVAARKDISKSMIETFAKDSSIKVRHSVVCRDDITEKMFQQLFNQLADDIGDIHDLLLFIEKVTKAHLKIAGQKLVFGDDYWNIDNDINYEKLGKLLPLLFVCPASREIQELEINIDFRDGSFNKSLIALSAVNTPTEVKRIILDRDYVDLSMTYDNNLDIISKQQFPNLECLSTQCSLNEFRLDFPRLKEISMESSGNDFHELLLMLLKSNLPNLETLSISAGNYGIYGSQKKLIKLPLDNAHKIWPNLKSLTIGARCAYDWGLLFTAPLFSQLDELVIELDESHNSDGEYDENAEAYMTMMCKNVADLVDALIDQSENLSNIESITVGIGYEFESLGSDLRFVKQKLARLQQSRFTIKNDVYVGGHE